EYDTTVVLRSAMPWMPYLDARGVLLRLHAGAPLPAGASFTRASPAWRWNHDGVLEEVAPGVLRTEWLDGQTQAWRIEPIARTNQIRNPRCEGAVVGVVGAGGSLPTH